MSTFALIILSFSFFASYIFAAINLSSSMTELGVSQSIRRITSALWLPILFVVITVFLLIFCLFVIATPFVIIAILIDYWYRKITNKSLLFDGEKVKFEL